MAVQAADEQGRVVARIDVDFAATATLGEGALPAPAELRNRMARLDIEAQGGAGSRRFRDGHNPATFAGIVPPGPARHARSTGNPCQMDVIARSPWMGARGLAGIAGLPVGSALKWI